MTGSHAGSGSFVLTLSGGDYWTDWLPADATAPQVQAALENLRYNSTQVIGAGNVIVTSPNLHGGPWTITFRSGLSNLNIVQLQAYHQYWDGNSWEPANDVSISTQVNGSGIRREVTVNGKSTAVLKSITGVSPSSKFFAPFALWVGSLPAYKGAENGVVTYYKNSSYIASWVNYNPNTSPWADPNWTSSNGTFKGYLNGLGSSTITLGNSISTSGGGTPSTTKLDAAYTGHYPVILPVIDRSSDSAGNISLHVTGWAWVQLDYSGNPQPSSAVNGASGLKGKVIRWAATGFEVGSGTSSGTSVPAKTVVLSPNQ